MNASIELIPFSKSDSIINKNPAYEWNRLYLCDLIGDFTFIASQSDVITSNWPKNRWCKHNVCNWRFKCSSRIHKIHILNKWILNFVVKFKLNIWWKLVCGLYRHKHTHNMCIEPLYGVCITQSISIGIKNSSIRLQWKMCLRFVLYYELYTSIYIVSHYYPLLLLFLGDCGAPYMILCGVWRKPVPNAQFRAWNRGTSQELF